MVSSSLDDDSDDHNYGGIKKVQIKSKRDRIDEGGYSGEKDKERKISS